MDLIQSLSRTEMKSITAGLAYTGGCHQCCSDTDDSNCGKCNNGTQCPGGYHTHKCDETECETPE